VNRATWLVRWRAPQLALWIGLALVAASQAFTGVAVRPLEERIALLERDRATRPQTEIQRIDAELERQTSPRQQLASFYGFFTRGQNITEQLAKLYDIAKANGLEMQRAEYRMSSVANRKLDRYQVIVPLQGSYSAIRVFVAAALRELPTMSLDHVQFQRKAVGESTVDGQITFSFHLAR
jgi:uncharacterized small protein (DUF1192 family)